MVPARLERNFALILKILAQSERHKNYTLEDVQRLVVPPLRLSQYFLWHWRNKTADIRSGVFISWAFLSDEAERGYVEGTRKLQPADWVSGHNAWIIDVAVWGSGGDLLLPAFHRIRARYPNVNEVKFRRWHPDRPRRYVKMELPRVVEKV